MFVKQVLVATVALAAAWVAAAPTEARTVRRTDVQPVSLTKKTEPSCCAPAPVETCCPEPCITYRHRGPKLCCDKCLPAKELVLKVKNPCTGCETDVPVCLPACCEGEPKVCNGSGFLGRNVVEYEWCCGFSVRVSFKHCGDLLVTTWGR